MLLPYIAILGLAIGLAHSYKIDKETCGTNAPFIGSAIAEAFEIAAKAVEVIDTPGAQRDANANRLIDLLFCGPNENPATIDLTMARASLAGVGGMSFEDEAIDTYTAQGTENQVVSRRSRSKVCL